MSSFATPLLAFTLALVSVLGVAGSLVLWVALDADARGSVHPLLWGVSSLSAVVLLYYVLWWRVRRSRTRPRTRTERGALAVVLAGVAGMGFGAVVSPPDLITQPLVWFAGTAVALPVAYWALRRSDAGGRN